MIRIKSFRAALFLTVLLLAAVASALCAGAAVSDEIVLYQNKETGYRVVIEDDADLLTASQEKALCEDMKPLTAYGDIAFWSTTSSAANEVNQAADKRYELFGRESAGIFAVNMSSRKISIQSYGAFNSVITDSRARSITDNVKSSARSGDYYACARDACTQMLTLLEGGRIAEPMKLLSFAALAAVLGLIVAVAVAFSKRSNTLIEDNDEVSMMKVSGTPVTSGKMSLVSSVYIPTAKNKTFNILLNVFMFILEIVADGILSGGSGGGHGSSSSGGGGSSGGSGGSASF